ncbi:histidine phosphatase family protein [Duganella sp. FT80W]|uniref:Histidine phosphatase family protein n=1 Tax=Duganella guangzhouensis TaxID=2666084 RepID=A0A6I2L0A4_9BURK|nr:histidine phosphatase family protein [Duganella guangzhouensis]MRW91805.1 histidine phosphatase family protein [Duganella guangzhouensis]
MNHTTILLIRHGETAWNAVRRLQGHIDIPLNEEGERQAAALGRALAGEQLDAIVSSDLQRAMQTAKAVAAQHKGLALRTDPQLRERAYGVFEGMLYNDIEDEYPADFALWQARDVDAVMPHGERMAESFRQFYDRAIAALHDVAVRHVGQTVAVVAHGGVLECAYRAARGIQLDSPRDFQVKNASINRFDVTDDKLVLTSWGEVDHLAPAAKDDII